MKHMHRLAALAAVGAVVSASSGTFKEGQIVQLDIVDNPSAANGSPKVKLTYTSPLLKVTTFAGEFSVDNLTPGGVGHGTGQGPANFPAYCVDIGKIAILGPSASYVHTRNTKHFPQTTYPPNESPLWVASAFPTAAYIVENYDTFGYTAAGIQLAIWNVLYDTDWTVNSGSFTVTSSSSAQAVTDANAILAAISVADVSLAKAAVFYPVAGPKDPTPLGRQALITSTIGLGYIPEPATYVMSFAGLLGVFAVARRGLKQGR